MGLFWGYYFAQDFPIIKKNTVEVQVESSENINSYLHVWLKKNWGFLWAFYGRMK